MALRLSTRGQYSVRTMLALAEKYGQGPVSLTQVSQREGISQAYLEQLVLTLRRKGLVESVRGAHGGYRLAMSPAQITIGDVLRAADECIAPVDCVDDDRHGECCDRETACSARPAWARLRDTMANLLDAMTLAELCPGNPLAEGTPRAPDEGVSAQAARESQE